MKRFGIILFFSSVMIAFPLTTYAYLDPGTGSYIIQVIAGAILVGGAGIVYSWNSLKAKIAGLFSGKDKKAEEKKSR